MGGVSEFGSILVEFLWKIDVGKYTKPMDIDDIDDIDIGNMNHLYPEFNSSEI